MSFLNTPDAPLLGAGIPDNALFAINGQETVQADPEHFKGGYIGIVSDGVLAGDLLKVAKIASGYGVTMAFQAPCEFVGHQV